VGHNVAGDYAVAARALIDNGAVQDSEHLLRRIYRDWVHPQTGRVLGMAFVDRLSGEVSVFREQMTTVDAVMSSFPMMGCTSVTAQICRANEHLVAADPIEDNTPEGPAHAVLLPKPAPSKKRIRKYANAIAATAVWRRRPPPQGGGVW
jgi:hypothetical protein